ncbi:MAG: DUF4136 domain-containing protein [Bacteroidales bacterium]
MKKLPLLALATLLLASCATIKVTSDYDKTAPFESYKTYAFTQEALNLGVDELNRSRLISAVENELSLKGFTKSETPDVLIDMNLVAETKQTATANTTGRGGYYGAGYRYGYGGGFSTTTIEYDSYTEGTLFVDMIDASKKQLVWQGRGIDTIEPNVSGEKREERINYAIKQIFSKYPPAL